MAGPRLARRPHAAKKPLNLKSFSRPPMPRKHQAFFRPHCDRVVTAAMMGVNVGVMGAQMAKNTKTKPVGARKPTTRSRTAKKRSRRVIFKSDLWYAGAA